MLLGHLEEFPIKSTKPKLFIIGDDDNFTSVSNFEKRTANMKEPKELVIVENGDHFWAEKKDLVYLSKTINNWIIKNNIL